MNEDVTPAPNNEDWLIVELIEALEEIDIDSKLATLNESSMLGKDGLRIFY